MAEQSERVQQMVDWPLWAPPVTSEGASGEQTDGGGLFNIHSATVAAKDQVTAIQGWSHSTVADGTDEVWRINEHHPTAEPLTTSSAISMFFSILRHERYSFKTLQ